MKKFILLISILVAFSCSKNSPELNSYILRVPESDVDAISKIVPIDLETGIFKAADDAAAFQLVAKIPAGISYELLHEDGTLMRDDRNEVPQPKINTVNQFCYDLSFTSAKYHLFASLPHAYSTSYVADYENNHYGYRMTNVATCNVFYSSSDKEIANNLAGRSYWCTADLNSNCGYKSYYTRIYFGGWKFVESPFIYYYDHDFKLKTDFDIPHEFYDKTITGLRLVMGEDAPKTITDPEGILWKRAEIYFDGNGNHYPENSRLGADLNDGAGGDWLYLYYTNDTRTGRQIMLVNPYLIHARVASGSFTGNAKLLYGVLGSGLLTWTTNKWKVEVSKLMGEIESYVPEEYKSFFKYGTSTQRFDFIRLYDKQMNIVSSDQLYPANFNRNAHGDDEIFISYNYITADDGDLWNQWL